MPSTFHSTLCSFVCATEKTCEIIWLKKKQKKKILNLKAHLIFTGTVWNLLSLLLVCFLWLLVIRMPSAVILKWAHQKCVCVGEFSTWTNKGLLLAEKYVCTSGQRNEAHWTARWQQDTKKAFYFIFSSNKPFICSARCTFSSIYLFKLTTIVKIGRWGHNFLPFIYAKRCAIDMNNKIKCTSNVETFSPYSKKNMNFNIYLSWMENRKEVIRTNALKQVKIHSDFSPSSCRRLKHSWCDKYEQKSNILSFECSQRVIAEID